MTSNLPYLIRALNDWIIDNGMTPHILVNAEFPGSELPQQFVQDGKIALNISPAAVQGLLLGGEEIMFSARFGGKSFNVRIPVKAVLAIYARENGKGMVFPEEKNDQKDGITSVPVQKKPELKIIK